MAIVFHIPGPLLSLTDSRRMVELKNTPAGLREALDELFATYPGLRDRILTEQGTVREHINLFVGKEDSRYLEGLATKLTDPAEILIVPAVSGGSTEREWADSLRSAVKPSNPERIWSPGNVSISNRPHAG